MCVRGVHAVWKNEAMEADEVFSLTCCFIPRVTTIEASSFHSCVSGPLMFEVQSSRPELSVLNVNFASHVNTPMLCKVTLWVC